MDDKTLADIACRAMLMLVGGLVKKYDLRYNLRNRYPSIADEVEKSLQDKRRNAAPIQ